MNLSHSYLKVANSPCSCREYQLVAFMSSDKRNSAIFDAFALASDNIWETRFTCHVVRNARTCASTSSSSLHFRYAYDMMSSSSAHWRGCVVGGGVCIIVSASAGGVCIVLSASSRGVCCWPSTATNQKEDRAKQSGHASGKGRR